MNVKYRIHEMAKDFNMPSKRIVELLGEYGLIAGDIAEKTPLAVKKILEG